MRETDGLPVVPFGRPETLAGMHFRFDGIDFGAAEHDHGEDGVGI